ncbi:MAG TPA: ABC transporter ATP-binding protein [Verrucomicrobiales bacterium]|nr:ABC transporter ATP-binding protein [Verrucomicrobiales bacterium]
MTTAVSTPETAENKQDQNPVENIVSVRGLTKVFRDFWGRPKARAVNDVDFDVRKGEVFGLLGPNGSGKSTTVKMLLGLLYPTKGHLEVFGHSPRHVATKARIGYLPEESYLYKYLDAAETLDFFGSLFQLNKKEREQRTEQLLEMVGLSQVRSRVVGEFSKGMQRRIGLAQALINDPDLVILDEPTSGLDPIGCREVKDLILALAARGKTVILSSHLLADVEDVCDRVVIYYGGRIQAQGTLNELLAKPDTSRITTPLLTKDVMQRVLDILRKEIGEEKIKVDVPTQNLENYFLNVVEQAREKEEMTSGATSGSRVAEYLRGDADMPSAKRQEKVLERLTLSEPVEIDESIPGEEPLAEEEKVLVEKLEQLTRPEPVQTTAAEPAGSGVQTPEQSRGELKAADEKLSSLLGGSNGDKTGNSEPKE